LFKVLFYLCSILTLLHAQPFTDYNSDPSVYFASKLTGKDAFQKPRDIMDEIWESGKPTEKQAKALKEMGAYEITDGGGTDPHGIATAVATGATEIFVVDVVENLISWKCHFNGWLDNELSKGTAGVKQFVDAAYEKLSSSLDEKTKKGVDNAKAAVDALGKIGTAGLIDSLLMDDVWQLFEEDQEYATKQELDNLLTLPVIPAKSKFLKGIVYGTVEGTTINNKFYGIEAGRKVKVHVFYVKVASNMGIGIGQDFNDYGDLVAEVTATLNLSQNADAVERMLSILKGSPGNNDGKLKDEL